MMDPKTSLAVDAPPVAPYDDGFSTESEDFNDSEEFASETQEPQPHIVTSRSSKSAVNSKNQSHLQHFLTSRELQTKTTRENNGEKSEQHCRGCNGYLTPLTERIKVMKAAALRHTGDGPALTKQCSCCHITYPLAILTDESRHTKPRCYMCNWALQKTHTPKVIGAKRARNEDVKVTHVDKTAVEEKRGCCRSCKVQLAPLARRLRSMKVAVLHHKKWGPPPTKQCSCCHITYPMAALEMNSRHPSCRTPLCFLCRSASMEVKPATTIPTNVTVAVAPVHLKGEYEKVMAGERCRKCGISCPLAFVTEESRDIKSMRPICNTCNESSVQSNAAEGTAPPRSDTIAEKKAESLQETKKTPEIIVVDSGDDNEEGELVEEGTCKCCLGQLNSLASRLSMAKDAASQHGGRGSPLFRQCACCRITYPSAALTSKSRKMTRVVPICLQCCRAGSAAIYEMLAASDEFIEAFKVENPTMARELLKKKETGKLAETAEKQRERIKKAQSKKALPTTVTVQKVEHLTWAGSSRNKFGPFRNHLGLYRPMARKRINAPRILLKNDTEHVQESQQNSHQKRSSRWLQQFEIIDGKTARERRLEARIATRELREENSGND